MLISFLENLRLRLQKVLDSETGINKGTPKMSVTHRGLTKISSLNQKFSSSKNHIEW